MAVFGIDLPDGVGVVGGDDDEYRRALHRGTPRCRRSITRFAQVGSFPAEYRIVRETARRAGSPVTASSSNARRTERRAALSTS